MTIQTGMITNRRKLATQISERLLGAPVTYTGVPSCAYRVGTNVSIDRQGGIEIDDENVRTILMPFFLEQGWAVGDSIPESTPVTDAEEPEQEDAPEPVREMPTEPSPEEPALFAPTTEGAPEHIPEIENCRVSIPVEMTVSQLTNLIRMLYSKQYLLNRAALDGRLIIPEALITSIKEQPPQTPEAFSQRLLDFKTRGELTGFDYGDGTVYMDVPTDETRLELYMACARLAYRIICMAKEVRFAKAELQSPENERFYMYAWLMRLGYGGGDMKNDRRLLIQNLKGHSAFPNAAAAARHKEKYAALRHVRPLESEAAQYDE